MKYKTALLINIIALFVSCQSMQISYYQFMKKSFRGGFTNYEKDYLSKQSWTKTYYRGNSNSLFIRPVYKKMGCKGFYPIDTIHISNYMIIKYERRYFIGPRKVILNYINGAKIDNCGIAHINKDIVRDKDVYICGDGLLVFQYETLFPYSDVKYHKVDESIGIMHYDIDQIIKISDNLLILKTKIEPKYFLLGLIEWGYYAQMELTEIFCNYHFYKEQIPCLGGYCKVVFPMYDK